MRQALAHAAVDVVGPRRRCGHGDAVGLERRLRADHRDEHVPVGSGRGGVAIVAGEGVARLRRPRVVERRVHVARHRPEEGIADARSVDRGRAVARHQETGRPVLLVDRVVDERQVEQRDVLDLQDGVLEHHALVQHDRAVRSGEDPAWRRLIAGRKGAVRQPVGLGADALEAFALELNVEIRCAEHGRCWRRRWLRLAQPREALRLEERAEPRRAVHLHLLGVDGEALRLVDEEQPPAREDRLRVPVHFVGEELQIVALDLDRSAHEAAVRPLLALAGIGEPRIALAVVERTGLRLRARDRRGDQRTVPPRTRGERIARSSSNLSRDLRAKLAREVERAGDDGGLAQRGRARRARRAATPRSRPGRAAPRRPRSTSARQTSRRARWPAP